MIHFLNVELSPDKIKEDLKPTRKDVFLTLGKAGLAGIPVVGGSVSALLDSILVSPLQKRRDEWLIYIVKKLQNLEKTIKNFKIENLGKNDEFVDSFVTSILIAVKNSKEEKRKILANSLLNTAVGKSSIEHSQKLTFLRYIDELEPLHIELLQFIENSKDEITKIQKSNPSRYRKTSELDHKENPVIEILLNNFPQLEGKHKRYLQDLMTRGLVNYAYMFAGTDFNNIIHHGGLSQEGKDFLDFISSPLP